MFMICIFYYSAVGGRKCDIANGCRVSGSSGSACFSYQQLRSDVISHVVQACVKPIFLSRTIAALNKDALSYHEVHGLYFLTVVFVAIIDIHLPYFNTSSHSIDCVIFSFNFLISV